MVDLLVWIFLLFRNISGFQQHVWQPDYDHYGDDLAVCVYEPLMYGAEINAYFEKDFRHAHRSVIGRISQEKERIQASRNIELENKIAVSEEKEDDSTKNHT